ncbi:unnamed protein product [Didymodactylos carnosus]|uniref:Uncharacterized protein n=1 Tax=Didymodactylos carnosus TaxID=1234261 RepID=A0A813Z8Z5_9BILA|nr:unnamed protein product [Didymodactylos carnosus]CAF3679348.1 unnamed protein product [Didymodactylos carnosus]
MSLIKNLEDYTIIWLDSDILTNYETKQRLRCIINYIKLFDNCDECLRYINTLEKDEKIFFLVSGHFCQSIVPTVHDLEQILFIYIFCNAPLLYDEWSKKYSKILGRLFTDQNSLYLKLIDDVKISNLSTITIFEEKSLKSLTKENGLFMWFQLLTMTLVQMSTTQDSKQDLIKICREYYEDNDIELIKIDEFERDYDKTKKQAIWWYTLSYVYYISCSEGTIDCERDC